MTRDTNLRFRQYQRELGHEKIYMEVGVFFYLYFFFLFTVIRFFGLLWNNTGIPAGAAPGDVDLKS
jgi:hypothetical protein